MRTHDRKQSNGAGSNFGWDRMKSLAFIVTILFACCLNANALTAKSPEQGAAMLWGWAIQAYFRSERKLPERWAELADVETSANYLHVIKKTAPDFMENYRFLKPDIKIPLGKDGERLIGMGINIRNPGARARVKPIVRSIIIASNSGHVEHWTISEARLSSAFREAGFDLSNYTGPSGNWEPEPDLGNSIPNRQASAVSNDLEIKKESDHTRKNYIGAKIGLEARTKKFVTFSVLLTILIFVTALLLRKRFKDFRK